MRTFLLCLACLTILVLAKPAAAQNMSPAPAKVDLKPSPPVELSVFLASLSAGSQSGDIGSQNHCFPTNWCQLARQECELDCAPCGSATNCYHYVCDSICYCFC